MNELLIYLFFFFFWQKSVFNYYFFKTCVFEYGGLSHEDYIQKQAWNLFTWNTVAGEKYVGTGVLKKENLFAKCH